MNVLIVGSGGREHALAWKVAQSPTVGQVYVTPGNAGTDAESGIENLAIDVMDFEGLAGFAGSNDIQLTIVGPENPLVAGLVDYFEERGLRCFGPNEKAAILEGSKTFTKEFMQRHRIPSADYRSFDNLRLAEEYLKTSEFPVVIKADGLAAGKGVVIAESLDDALTATKDMLSGHAFGEAGHRVVIEEYLRGEEASFIVIADGVDFLAFASSQDHKPVGDGDTGLNTGGMGAYSPAPVVDARVHERIIEQVIQPTLKGMETEGRRYRGFLYAGLMIDSEGQPRVIEFNCRFGDPETQPIMMRLETDLALLCDAATQGTLNHQTISFSPGSALTVVLASAGYPGSYQTGEIIVGCEGLNTPQVRVFHAGTRRNSNGELLTNGGRVLGVTAMGTSVAEAQARVYETVKAIEWPGIYYRKDIGYRALAREK